MGTGKRERAELPGASVPEPHPHTLEAFSVLLSVQPSPVLPGGGYVGPQGQTEDMLP